MGVLLVVAMGVWLPNTFGRLSRFVAAIWLVPVGDLARDVGAFRGVGVSRGGGPVHPIHHAPQKIHPCRLAIYQIYQNGYY
jgi:hypothetical protein